MKGSETIKIVSAPATRKRITGRIESSLKLSLGTRTDLAAKSPTTGKITMLWGFIMKASAMKSPERKNLLRRPRKTESIMGKAWKESTWPQNVEFERAAGLKKYAQAQMRAVFTEAIPLTQKNISAEIARSARFAGSLNRISTGNHGSALLIPSSNQSK